MLITGDFNELSVKNGTITFTETENVRSLNSLNLVHCQISLPKSDNLIFSNLQFAYFEEVGSVDEVVELIHSAPALEHISVVGADLITAIGCKLDPKLARRLRSLCFNGVGANQTLEFLNQLTSLESLVLENISLPESYEASSISPPITSLALRNVKPLAKFLDYAWNGNLIALEVESDDRICWGPKQANHSLRTLDISGAFLTDEQLAAVCSAVNLAELHLHGTNLSLKGLSQLGTLDKLELVTVINFREWDDLKKLPFRCAAVD